MYVIMSLHQTTREVKETNEDIQKVLKRLEDESRRYSLRSVGPIKGKIIAEIINKYKPKRILEVGTLYGYSAILMAELLPDVGKLVTIEIDNSNANIAKKNFQEAGLSYKIEVVVGNALEVIPNLQNEQRREKHEPQQLFDLLFLDGRKNQYLKYLHLVEDKNLLNNDSGIVIADNVGAYKKDMLDYLEYVRKSGKYRSKTIATTLEFTDNVYDAIELSTKVA
jgi:predicted O-methyltransferase YrrM